MNTTTANIFKGLLFTCLILVGSMSLQGQILRDATGTVKDAGSTATNPVKDARGTVKDIGRIPDDIKNAKRDIVQPAKDLQREVDGLQNDIQNTKNDINGMRGNRQASKDEQAKQDSLAAADKEAKRIAYEKEKARRDSVYKSKLRTGTVTVDGDNGSGEVVSADPSRTVLLPPNTIPSARPSANPPRTRTRTRSTLRSSTQRGGVSASTTRTSGTSAASGSSAASGTRTRSNTPDATTSRGDAPASTRTVKYYDTPAKRYLERSDFDEETLDDLFEAAIWTGPDSVHTARSIDYMLQQYRMDLDEVKRIDPNYDVGLREDRYRKWSGLFYRNTRPLKED